MSARDNLSPQQFMSVSDLMNTHSADALRARRGDAFDAGDSRVIEHDNNTRMRDVYPRKAAHFTDPDYPEFAGAPLDEHIRSGSIDPVLLQRASTGETEISEGHHRIARAHQLGVQRLPVSYDPGSQVHRDAWGN